MITNAQAAKILTVTIRRITQMVEEGKLVRPAAGKISCESIAELIRDERKSADDVPMDYEANKARKMKADADMSEISVERERGRLLDAGRTRRSWEAAVLHARSKMLAMPERLGQQLATAPNIEAAKGILGREINEVLESLAECRVEMPIDEVEEPEAELYYDDPESDEEEKEEG